MKKCLVIGGGFAGLSAAAHLIKNNFQVELIEASPKLGGRAYSLNENDTIIDNGQHIMMGCYYDTLEFFKIINAEENLSFQKNLTVNFIKPNFEIFPLKSDKYFYPFNLLSGLLNYKALKFTDRLSLLKVFAKLPLYQHDNLNSKTVFDWLKDENQNEDIINAFWEILVVGTLNTNLKKASAKIFVDVLKQIFLKGNKAATIVLPKYGLSETYCEKAEQFIRTNGGRISLSETIQEIFFGKEKATKIQTNKREISDFDYVIFAIPHFAVSKVKGFENVIDDLALGYSCILSIHLWVKENKLKDEFYGLINSPVHWIFNKKSHLTIVISDANKYLNTSKEEIIEMVSDELGKYIGLKEQDIINYKVIKEKRATFIPENNIISMRPDSRTKIKNLFLAGDWINTGLPSTIESAVKSGKLAAKGISHFC